MAGRDHLRVEIGLSNGWIIRSGAGAVLVDAGFDRFAPAEGAFYLYCDVAHLTNDSRDFCKRMLAESGVATTPGIDFDRARGAGTLRISFAGSTAEMEEAVRRLKAWRRT